MHSGAPGFEVSYFMCDLKRVPAVSWPGDNRSDFLESWLWLHGGGRPEGKTNKNQQQKKSPMVSATQGYDRGPEETSSPSASPHVKTEGQTGDLLGAFTPHLQILAQLLLETSASLPVGD